MTAAHEDKYFPARLNVPLYPELSEEEANVMQTKLYIDEEKHDISYAELSSGICKISYLYAKLHYILPDIDECSSNAHSCGVNAVCNNTVGSYACACKAGYSGDGRKCTGDLEERDTVNDSCVNLFILEYRRKRFLVDIDECASGTDDCHSSRALCTNTVGSFNCSCNSSYIGDGRTCNLPSECQNYGSLNSGSRRTSYYWGNHYCDSSLGPGWFRFQGSAGTRMATSCPPTYRCGTYYPGWLSGGHSSVADGQVTRTVYFRRGYNCYYYSRTIKVRNCGSYYVYYLSGTPTCNLRYCGTN
ncbi:unnamed protein product [Porites lobata]|uniref:EGF-like domain-containing protein n=1 Tax=Porites lobata TaxID=104759 RepID=A0ABN8SG38_9CNID|nr:unnamed protein product [Porites lobata]